MQKIIFNRLEGECFGNRTIEVYGGVYHFANHHANNDGGIDVFEDICDLERLCRNTIGNAKFWTPEVKPSQVLRNICDLLYVDYMLLEALFGCRLESFDEV